MVWGGSPLWLAAQVVLPAPCQILTLRPNPSRAPPPSPCDFIPCHIARCCAARHLICWLAPTSLWYGVCPQISVAERDLLFLIFLGMLWRQAPRVVPCLDAPWRKGSREWTWPGQHRGLLVVSLSLPVLSLWTSCSWMGEGAQFPAQLCPQPGPSACPWLRLLHQGLPLSGSSFPTYSPPKKSGAACSNASAAGETQVSCSIFKYNGVSLHTWSLGV